MVKARAAVLTHNEGHVYSEHVMHLNACVGDTREDRRAQFASRLGNWIGGANGQDQNLPACNAEVHLFLPFWYCIFCEGRFNTFHTSNELTVLAVT